MLEHHIQRSIISRLATVQSLRFSDLKPRELENKAFDYHLKLLIRDKLVNKNQAGEYQLTSFGRKVGISVGLDMSDWFDRAHSTMFLIIKQHEKWLLYRRLNHPLIHRVGFMHVRPNATEDILKTASRSVKERTNLDASFTVRGHGYLRVYESDNLESFTHFTLLLCQDAKGELLAADVYAEYEWYENPDFTAPEMLPNMADLFAMYSNPKQSFLEKTYRI